MVTAHEKEAVEITQQFLRHCQKAKGDEEPKLMFDESDVRMLSIGVITHLRLYGFHIVKNN